MSAPRNTTLALPPDRTPKAAAYVRLALAAAREALAADPAFHPDLSFMSHAAGVTPRTLQRHVAQVLHMAPRAVVERLRLNAARQTLASGKACSVLDVAARHGFEHAGRFAIRYAAAFDEAPSATLRRARARDATER
ncbi:MAG: helix-turn-helix domain-containing protein, partial [Pseudomonadota bacterium]